MVVGGLYRCVIGHSEAGETGLDGFQRVVVWVVFGCIGCAVISAMGDGECCLVGGVCLNKMVLKHIPIVVVGILCDGKSPINECVAVLVGYLDLCQCFI